MPMPYFILRLLLVVAIAAALTISARSSLSSWPSLYALALSLLPAYFMYAKRSEIYAKYATYQATVAPSANNKLLWTQREKLLLTAKPNPVDLAPGIIMVGGAFIAFAFWHSTFPHRAKRFLDLIYENLSPLYVTAFFCLFGTLLIIVAVEVLVADRHYRKMKR
jgi:lysylphosphatidylglycerol synthetase-like protein (DUF2156 family)